MADPYLRPVRLCTDRYCDQGVHRGTVGVVVENWGGGTYEVEFSDATSGETVALLTLPSDEVEIVTHAGASTATSA